MHTCNYYEKADIVNLSVGYPAIGVHTQKGREQHSLSVNFIALQTCCWRDGRLQCVRVPRKQLRRGSKQEFLLSSMFCAIFAWK